MTSRNPNTWMWADACEILERAGRLQQQFFQIGRTEARRPTWEPPMDIFETEEEIWMLIALPGVEADHIKVIVDGNILIVTGERPLPRAARGALIRRLEIPHGRLERRIELTGGRFELDRRELVNGCLLLSLHKLGY